MKTLYKILTDGIKPDDWTYCKPEYVPHDGCNVGMPKEFTPDGTKKNEVTILYIVTARYRDGEIRAYDGFMYLSDGRFYWYDNLWEDDDTVEREIEDERYMEPIAWISYMNIPETNTIPIAPCNADAVLIPLKKVMRYDA